MVIDVIDSSITEAGYAGIEIGYQNQGAIPSDVTGMAMDNFLVQGSALVVNDSNVLVDDPGLFFSPYNWKISGSQYALSQTPGAYIKTVFTGTSLKINLSEDLLVNSSTEEEFYPRLRYKIDNQEEVEVQLNSTISTITAATGLESGSHNLLITFPHVGGGLADHPDRWTVPVHGIKFIGLTIDEGGSISLPTLKPKRLLVYGDSISEGVGVAGATGSFPNTDSDATKSVSQLLANDLNAEVGFRALGGGGWTISGSGGVPPVFVSGDDGNSMWNKYSEGESLFVDGQFVPQPDYIYMNHGTNDWGSSDSSVTASVRGWLDAVRVAAPDAYIFLTIPFGQYKAGAITTAYNDYIAENPTDTKTLLFDLGPEAAAGLNSQGTPSEKSFDGLHPNIAANINLEAQLFSLIQADLNAQENIAPITTASPIGGLFNTPQDITLTCDDGLGSGCDKIYYTTDGSDPTVGSDVYFGTITIPITTTLKFFSQDRNGNSETFQTETYIIDTGEPVVLIDSPLASSFINDNTPELNYTVSDGSVIVRVDGDVVSGVAGESLDALADGEHTITIESTDLATNVGVAQVVFTIDTQIPIMLGLSPVNQSLPSTTTSTNLSVRTSEVATCKYATSPNLDFGEMAIFDNTNDSNHTTLIMGLESGMTYSYYVKCIDLAGNFMVDYPQSTFTVENIAQAATSIKKAKVKVGRQINKFKDALYIAKEKFKLEGQDDALFNGTVKIYKDGHLWKTILADAEGVWKVALKISNDETKKIKIMFYDFLGNFLGKQSAKIEVDTDKPKFKESISEKIDMDRNDIILFTAGDDGSGMDHYEVKLEGFRDWRKQKEDFYRIPGVVPSGTHSFYVRAYDKAGNYAEEKIIVTVSQYKQLTNISSTPLNLQNNSEQSVEIFQPQATIENQVGSLEEAQNIITDEVFYNKQVKVDFVWWKPWTW